MADELDETLTADETLDGGELEGQPLGASTLAELLAGGGALGEREARVGRYRILERLGQGAMGVVLAAHDEQLDRKVALKFLIDAKAGATARARLFREARSLARLSHPNVVAIYEVGEAEEVPYLAMELVVGQTLRDWLSGGDERGPGRLETLRMFEALGQGLAAAHELGIVHRDFKPDNVLVGHDGRPRVVDFGLARLGHREQDEPEARAAPREELLSAGPAAMTRTGALMGTPAYMAPEQWRSSPAEAHSDQFAFCVALFEAVYARPPFAAGADNLMALMDAVLEDPPADIPAKERLPAALHAAILRGLAKDPEARWPSMEPLLEHIRAALSEAQPGIFEDHPPMVQRAMGPLFVSIPLLWLGLELAGVVEYSAESWALVSACQVLFVGSIVLSLRKKIAALLNEPRVLGFPLVILSFVLCHRAIAWLGEGSFELMFAYDFVAISALGAILTALVDRRLWLAPTTVGGLAVLAVAKPSWAPHLWVAFSLAVPLALLIGLARRRDPLRGAPSSLSRLTGSGSRSRPSGRGRSTGETLAEPDQR